ncbi:hypothetical protein NHX12_019437 [Muraenolepis orangiensis]|uniref:Uncharacterized protein n=1 Tax=Muraenolepis orangiensis TaxID=630683 RepID=A0A9Q0ETM8_9TELE|nr:hypothetical protein NHX12_019437 [Muraenolepis orangiensis]
MYTCNYLCTYNRSLSYSRLIPAGAHEICLGLLRNIPSPFSDMSFEVVKNIPPKRKLDDSCLDNSFETLAKKPYIPSTASPDLGLGCDSFNVDTPTVNQQLLLDRQKAVRSQTKDTVADVKSHLNLSSSSGSCVLFEESDGTPPNGQVYRGNVFDFNIESILCLSPISCVAGQPIGSDHNVEGCSCPRSNSPLASSPRAGQQVEEGVGQEEQSADWEREGNGASNSANAGHPSGGSIQFLATVSGSSKPLLKPLPLHCQLTTASWNRKSRGSVLPSLVFHGADRACRAGPRGPLEEALRSALRRQVDPQASVLGLEPALLGLEPSVLGLEPALLGLESSLFWVWSPLCSGSGVRSARSRALSVLGLEPTRLGLEPSQFWVWSPLCWVWSPLVLGLEPSRSGSGACSVLGLEPSLFWVWSPLVLGLSPLCSGSGALSVLGMEPSQFWVWSPLCSGSGALSVLGLWVRSERVYGS